MITCISNVYAALNFFANAVCICYRYYFNFSHFQTINFHLGNLYFDFVPPWYLYLVVVEWLACLNDPESYAGGGIAARRVTHAVQVKGDKPEEKVSWSKE